MFSLDVTGFYIDKKYLLKIHFKQNCYWKILKKKLLYFKKGNISLLESFIFISTCQIIIF